MKLLVGILSLSAIIASNSACCCEFDDYSFYINVNTGVSSADSAHVVACCPPWSQATQGYNARLGKCPIAGFSVGCEWMHVVDFEVGIFNRSLFKYRKCQSSAIGNGSYTRKFDLDVTSILFSANFLGRSFACFSREVYCGKLYPIIGAGIGASNLLITNYRTTGLPPTGDSAPYASFSAENEHTLRRHVTYTFLVGLEYSCGDRWAIGTGYRWFNAGHFKGPRYQRVASGAAVDVASAQWKMRLRADEWFIALKIFI